MDRPVNRHLHVLGLVDCQSRNRDRGKSVHQAAHFAFLGWGVEGGGFERRKINVPMDGQMKEGVIENIGGTELYQTDHSACLSLSHPSIRAGWSAWGRTRSCATPASTSLSC